MRGVTRPRRRRWGAGTTSPPAITSGARASPSLSEARTSLLLAGADDVRGPVEKQQATTTRRPDDEKPSLPLFTSGSRAKAWASGSTSLRPLRHFIAPFSTSPTPRQRGHHQGEGNQTVIGRKPPRPREGCVPGSLPNPAFRTAYPARWLRLFLFHRSVRLSAAPDSGLLLGGSASRPSKRSYELS